MTDLATTHVPLSALIADPLNVRAATKKPSAALVASIHAKGLLTPLLVRPADDKGRYPVSAGERRRKALIAIHGAKSDHSVAVRIISADPQEAREISLTENLMREALHPVDEFEAFAALAEAGRDVPAIASHFGSTETWVRQRLQLARLAPKLRQAWRDGTLGAEQARALSASDDHARQEAVWEKAKKEGKASDGWTPYAQRPESLRRAVLNETIALNDSRVLLVGIEAYEAAGGTFTEDLFAEDRRLTDGDLLDRLVNDRLADHIAEFKSAGWAWAMTEADLRREHGLAPYQLKHAPWKPYCTPEELAELSARDKEWRRMEEIKEVALDRAEADPALRAITGVVMEIGHKGEIHYLTLCQLPAPGADDSAAEDSDTTAQTTAAPPEPEEPAAPQLSQKMREDLSHRLTLAVSEAIAQHPSLALQAVVAAISASLGNPWPESPIRLKADPWSGLKPEHDGKGETWLGYFRSLDGFSNVELINTLTRLTAPLIDVTAALARPASRCAIIHALTGYMTPSVLAGAVRNHFDAEAYFTAAPAAFIDMAADEMGVHIPKGKKPERAALAIRFAQERGWLPPELRTPAYDGPSNATTGGETC